MGIFGHEKRANFMLLYFDVEPTGQFCFCLGHIKGFVISARPEIR